MIFEYQCLEKHFVEIMASVGQAPLTTTCPQHHSVCTRYFGSINVTPSNDIFRKTWISSKTTDAIQKRGVGLDPLAPKDKFEAKEIEKATGRVYFGNDYSQLSPETIKAAESNRDT